MATDNRESPAAPLIARVEAHVLRWPVAVPVRTSFGVMHDRPAVLVRVEDAEGAFGWGEAWCNFPSCGAEHRARLIETVLAPLVVGRSFVSPEAALRELSNQTAVLAIQSGEPGPMAQAIAGVDIALHDLAARRAGLPLWRMLAGGDRTDGRAASASVAVYASGINPDRAGQTVARLIGEGHTAFKLKVGFGAAADVANLVDVRAAAGRDAAVMVDANQAWDLETALAMAERLAPCGPGWIEEPLRADRPWPEWQRLAAASSVPLAAGENANGDEAFDALIASRSVAVVQPDIAKWGGVSGVIALVPRIRAARLRWCPHYLGAGIGLAASAHALAAFGSDDGLLEIDSNDNPLRTGLCPALASLAHGRITLGDAVGLGVEPTARELRELAGSR